MMKKLILFMVILFSLLSLCAMQVGQESNPELINSLLNKKLSDQPINYRELSGDNLKQALKDIRKIEAVMTYIYELFGDSPTALKNLFAILIQANNNLRKERENKIIGTSTKPVQQEDRPVVLPTNIGHILEAMQEKMPIDYSNVSLEQINGWLQEVYLAQKIIPYLMANGWMKILTILASLRKDIELHSGSTLLPLPPTPKKPTESIPLNLPQRVAPGARPLPARPTQISHLIPLDYPGILNRLDLGHNRMLLQLKTVDQSKSPLIEFGGSTCPTLSLYNAAAILRYSVTGDIRNLQQINDVNAARYFLSSVGSCVQEISNLRPEELRQLFIKADIPASFQNNIKVIDSVLNFGPVEWIEFKNILRDIQRGLQQSQFSYVIILGDSDFNEFGIRPISKGVHSGMHFFTFAILKSVHQIQYIVTDTLGNNNHLQGINKEQLLYLIDTLEHGFFHKRYALYEKVLQGAPQLSVISLADLIGMYKAAGSVNFSGYSRELLQNMLKQIAAAKKDESQLKMLEKATESDSESLALSLEILESEIDQTLKKKSLATGKSDPTLIPALTSQEQEPSKKTSAPLDPDLAKALADREQSLASSFYEAEPMPEFEGEPQEPQPIASPQPTVAPMANIEDIQSIIDAKIKAGLLGQPKQTQEESDDWPIED